MWQLDLQTLLPWEMQPAPGRTEPESKMPGASNHSRKARRAAEPMSPGPEDTRWRTQVAGGASEGGKLELGAPGRGQGAHRARFLMAPQRQMAVEDDRAERGE